MSNKTLLDKLLDVGMSKEDAEKWIKLRDLKITEVEKELDWQKAKQHFDEYYEGYKELLGRPGVNASFAILFTFEPLAQRYNNGERTQELYDEMMDVE